MKCVLRGGLVVVILFLASTAIAQDWVTVKQDGTGNYTTIQAALDDPSRFYNEIVVYPGVYQENLLIAGGVTLRGYYGPLLTAIDGQKAVGGRQNTVKVNAGVSDVEIIGLYITGGSQGIYISTSTDILIANCVIHANTNAGVLLYNEKSSEIGMLNLRNNVLMSNAYGLYFSDDQDYYCYLSYANVFNNVFFGNSAYAIAADHSSAQNVERVVIDYNCYNGNVSGDYGTGLTSSKGTIVPGSHEVFQSPLFLGTATGPGYDVRLRTNPASPCIDEGSPSVSAADPDGTRNDIGAYGGPYAASFYESPNDGPIVRNVTITPGSVAQGETFTVQATVAVR